MMKTVSIELSRKELGLISDALDEHEDNRPRLNEETEELLGDISLKLMWAFKAVAGSDEEN